MREQTGLTEAECRGAAWVVAPDGPRYRGAGAVSVACDALLGVGPIFYSVYRLPIIRQTNDAVYEWVVRNRQKLSRWASATPAIKQDPPWRPER